MMEPSLSSQDVRQILLQLSTNGLTHGQNLYNCVARGNADFLDQYGADPTLLNRAKAEVRNSKILHHVRTLMLENIGNYKYVEDGNSFYVQVETCVNARFKKLDERGRSADNKTNRDRSYRRQESDLLPFSRQAKLSVNLDVGYALDATGRVSGILFSCCAPLNMGVHWVLPAIDLNIVEPQMPIFTTQETEVLPILQLDIKEHLKKSNNDRQPGGSI